MPANDRAAAQPSLKAPLGLSSIPTPCHEPSSPDLIPIPIPIPIPILIRALIPIPIPIPILLLIRP